MLSQEEEERALKRAGEVFKKRRREEKEIKVKDSKRIRLERSNLGVTLKHAGTDVEVTRAFSRIKQTKSWNIL